MTYLVRPYRAVGDSGDFWSWATDLLGPSYAALPSDQVDQTANGTTTSAADFTTVNGVCKPQNFPALNAVRDFQRQLNRVAEVKGFGKVAPDGSVGPATLALFRRVQAAGAGSVMGDASSCMGIAPDVDILGAQVHAVADSLGAPASVSDPVSLSVPTITTKSGKTVVAPDSGLVGSLAALPLVEKIALAGIAGGIGYLLLAKSKRKRRK